MGVITVNKIRSMRWGAQSARRSLARILAVSAALTFFGGMFSSAGAVIPIMHNSSSVGSTKWGGGWGNTPNSKYGKFTCSTCHNAGLDVGNAKSIKSSITAPSGSFPGSTVVFNTYTTYGSDKTHATSQRICEVCHTITGHHTYNNASANHNGDVNCTEVCHPHSAGFKPAGGSCTSCHGNPPTTVANLASPKTYALGNPEANAGAHDTHYTVKGIQCAACHNGYTTSPMGNSKIELGFAINATNWAPFTGTAVTYGTYTGHSPLNGTYTFGSTSVGTTVGTSAAYRNSCNVYCHGAWTGSAGTKPSWTGIGTDAVCGKCHGASASAPPAAGNHGKHAGNASYTGYSISCTTCHPGRVTGDQHIKGVVHWKFSTAILRVGTGAAYTRTGAVNSGTASGNSNALAGSGTYGTCSGIYCHSYIVNDVRTYKSGFQWGSTLPTDCTGCHGNDNNSATPMTADAHKAHINNTSVPFSGMAFKCNECHASTVGTDNRTLQSGAYGPAGVHVNGTPTVVWGPINNGKTAYTTGSTCGTTLAGTTIYCHSDGAGGAPKVIPSAWKTVADSTQGSLAQPCAMCHGGLKADSPNNIATKKHPRHIGVGTNIPHADLACAECHRRTATAANAIMTNTTGMHLSGAVNVSLNNKFNGVLANWTGVYRKASDDCSNTYCHGQQVTPAWGSAQTRACGDCHGTNNAGLLSTPHNKHYNTTTLPTAANGWTNTANSTGTTYIISCGVCHGVTAATNHVNGPQVTGKGDAEVVFNLPGNQTGFTATVTKNTVTGGDSRGYQYSASTTCSVYCHSNAYAGAPVYRSTRAWNGTNPCGSCHAVSANKTYSDWSPGHTRHMGSNSTQRQYSSNTNFRCGTCHNATIVNGSNTTFVTNTKDHVNGYRNVSSNTWAGNGTKTLIWNGATYTCTNTYCHSNGRTTPAQYNTTPSWRTGTVNCLSCHGGRDASTGAYTASAAGFKLSTTHSQHLKYPAANITCNICHSKTVSSAASPANAKWTLLKDYTGVRNHVNKTKNVTFTDITYGSYTAYKTATKKCGNVSCHGGTTRNAWSESGPLNNNNTCVHCHGVATTSASVPNSGVNRRFFAPGWGGTGTDTDGNTASTDYQVGAHFKHLSSAIRVKIKCNECHLVPSNPFDTGHMAQPRFTVSQTLNFSQSSSARWNAATSTTLASFGGYTSGTATKAATCSSVYCHGNRLKNGDTAGSSRKPSWNQSLTGGAPSATVCGRCHGAPPNSVTGSHNGVVFPACTCHNMVMNTTTGAIINTSLHMNGVIDVAADDCKGCHGTGATKDVQTEFAKNSHHTNKAWASITNFDCVVCHAEGSIVGGAVKKNATYHNNPVGVVDLYSADNRATIYSINVSLLTGHDNATNTTLDTFCFSCHDSNGAAAVTSGNGFTDGRTATNPFNDTTLSNGYDQQTRAFGAAPAALNVYDAFATTNYSHHAVRGARYTKTTGLSFGTSLSAAGLLSSTVTLANGTTGVNDTSTLHCSDCHSVAWSAHGSANEYLLQTATSENPTTEHTGLTDVVCVKCHASASYAGAGSHTGNGGDLVWTPGSTGATRASGNGHITGIACLNCHDGNVGFGGIHGVPNATYTAGGSGGTYNKRRFMPGSSLYMYDPDTGDAGTDAGWETATPANKCYTLGTAGTVGSCTKHATGTNASRRNTRRPVTY